MSINPVPTIEPLASLPLQANLTPLQVARFLDISPDTVYREILRGGLPAIRIGRVLRIPREPFVAWYTLCCK